MPVAGIVQPYEVSSDGFSIPLPLVHSSLEEDLYRSVCGLSCFSASGCFRIQGQPAKGDKALHEGRVGGVGILVTVPAAVRPLPLHESMCQLFGSIVGQAEGEEIVDGVAFL